MASGRVSPAQRGIATAGQTITPSATFFGRHESFPPRYGWLKKGVDLVRRDDQVFTREDAPVQLGVGKNMVKSIRYWCLAFKLLDFIPVDKGKSLRLTGLAGDLLGANGWDPFLEDQASLWLLHWELLKRPCQATLWELFFCEFNQPLFSSESLFVWMRRHIEQKYVKADVSDSTLKGDLSCLLRMYARPDMQSEITDDSIASPWIQLNLIQKSSGGDFAINVGPKVGLRDEIVVAMCLDYMENELQAKTASFSSLLYSGSGPGNICKIDEQTLYASIERISERNKYIHLSEAAGLLQLSVTGQPTELKSSLLDSYYANSR